MIPSETPWLVQPQDVHNQKLVQLTHPDPWTNPKPAKNYNLVVVGGGTAGLVAAAGAAGLGAKVALVEKHLMGGDCLNYGCVPSKALIRAGRWAKEARGASSFGQTLDAGNPVDFSGAMERLRRLRAQISEHDSASRFRDLGVDVFIGEGKFTGRRTLQVNGVDLHFSKALIATGGRANLLPIPGLSEARPLTNESLFSLTEIPRRLAVIGAGPIGCEIGQALHRLGSSVTIINDRGYHLPREDPDAAGVVQKVLVEEGIRLIMSAKTTRVELRGKEKILTIEDDGKQIEVVVDEILLSVGRAPNVENLGLEQAGVEFNRQGVKVDDGLQTTNSRIYAAGDVCSVYKFTHAADAMARIVLTNALFLKIQKVSRLTIPWCTYTEPEIAHVGLYESEIKEKNLKAETLTVSMSEVDRAILEGDEKGFARIHFVPGKGTILGATIVSSHAGESIWGICLAMAAGATMGTLSSTIHPYPTQSEVWKKLGDAYMKSKLSPLVVRILKKYLSFRR